MEWAIARPPQWNIANHPAMRTIERYLIFLQSSMVVCENLFVAGTARARQRAREIQEFMFARAQPDPEHDNRFHVKIAMSPNKDEDTLFLEGEWRGGACGIPQLSAKSRDLFFS